MGGSTLVINMLVNRRHMQMTNGCVCNDYWEHA